ncbi:S8 family serine peptidase, partial [Cellulomonas sp. P5_C6]
MPPRLRPVLAVALGLGLTLGLVPSAGAAAPAPIDPTTGERPTDRGPVAVAADPQPSDADGYAPGHVLVRFADSTTSSQQRSALSSVGGSREGTIAGTGFVEVAVGDDDPQTVADALADDPRVAEVQVDHVRHATAWTNDPLLSYTWPYMDLTRMPRAWDVSTGSGVVVAVLDTGVSATHEDLTGSVLPGIDLVDGDSDATDEHGHGTLVAGIVAAHGNNGKGIAGTAYGAKILPVRVLDETGNGNDETIAEGISWAVAHGADVINLSLGGPEVAPLLRSAIVSAVAAGVVVVAAAGNDGTETPFFPAAYAPDIDGLLAVGATDDDGALTSFSSWGDWVSLTAPGWSIVGPALDGGYASGSGTSFAAPQVSGTAALVLAHAPTRTPAQVEAALVSTARDAGPRGVDDYYGSGVLDAAAAVTVNDPVRAAVSVPLDRAASDPGGGDDSAARARAMTGGWADGTLAPEGDVDWYRAPVPAAGWYDVRVDLPYADEDQELDPVLEVRDAQGQVIGRADDAGTNVSEHVVVPAAAAGALLVGVTNGTGHASSQPYEVSVTLADQQVRFAEAAQTGAADTRT